MVARGLRYSIKGAAMPSGKTWWLGKNLRASALGVFSVWIKMERRPRPASDQLGWWADEEPCVRGRLDEEEEEMW